MGRVETLILLKHDLGIHTNAHDEYLRFLLKSAKERISREGIRHENRAVKRRLLRPAGDG